MSTYTQTYTITNIRKVFERFKADLFMLVYRTQAMEIQFAEHLFEDVCLMAMKECLERIDIQLVDSRGYLVRVHQYTILRNTLAGTHRPGGNDWPRLPNGELRLLVTPSNLQRYEMLKKSGELKLQWQNSSHSTNYVGMQNVNSRMYTSSNYGLQRNSYRI